jgi:hypothetical protein
MNILGIRTKETPLSLPHESNYGKSTADLVLEIGINQERVNSSAEGARKMFLENQALRLEQRRNWEQYQLAIKQRNEFELKLEQVHENNEGSRALRAELKEATSERDRAMESRDRVNDHNRRLLAELTPLRALQRAIALIQGNQSALDEALDTEEDDDDDDD